MKTKALTTLLFSMFIALYVSFISTCDNSTEPRESQTQERQRLIIESGYFNPIERADSNGSGTAIELTYYVTKEKCCVGGYGIKWDSTHSGQVSWYMMETLWPGRKRVLADTFRVRTSLTSEPTLQMQGYRLGSSESHEELRAECTLRPKQ